MGPLPKRIRITLNLLGALLTLVIVVVLILRTSWAQRQIERRVITAIETSTGARAEVRDFEFRPLSLELVLRGLVLHGTEPAGAPPMFSARTVTARLQLRALFERAPLFSSLDWDEAEINVATHPDGSTNLAAPPPQEGPGASVDRVTLSKTTIFWNDQQLRADLEASNLAVLVRRIPSGKYSGSVSASQVLVRGPKVELPRISFVALAEFSRAGLETQSLSWQCAGIAGRGSLTVTRWNPMALRLDYETGGKIQKLAGVFGLDEIRGGEARSQGIISFQESKLEAQGRVEFREVSIQTGQRGLSGISVSANFSANSNQISFRDMNATLLNGTIQGTGDVSFADPAPRFRIQGSAARISVRQVLHALSEREAAARISSQASGTVAASWTGRFRNFRGEYSLNFTPEGPDRPGVLPVTGSIKGTSRLDPALIFKIDLAELRTRSAAASARGTLGAAGATLALGVSATDFEEWRPLIESWSRPERPIPLQLRSTATFRGEIAGPFRGIELRGELTSGPLEFRGTHWDSVRAGILISPQVIEISSGHLEFRDSQINLDATFPIQHKGLDSARPLRLSMNADKTRLEGLLAALGWNYPLQGSLTGKVELSGSLDNTVGQGEIRVENGAVYDEPFDSLSTRLWVERSVWQIKDIVLAKGQGLARGEGKVNYPDRQLQISLSGNNLQLGQVKRLQSALEISAADLQGLIAFDIRVQGWPGAIEMEAGTTVRDVVAKGVPLGQVTARITQEGGRTQIRGRSEGAGGTVQFSSEKSTAADAPFTINADYQALRLDPWLRLLTGRETAPGLTATGKAQGSYLAGKPESAHFSVQADQFSIEYPDLNLQTEGPVRATYSARRLTFERFRVQGPSTNLQVEGSARVGMGGSLAVVVEGTAEAKLLSLVDPALQASGASSLKLRVTGSFARPSLHGTMSVQNVSAGYGDLPFRVTGLTGDVILEGDRATLRSLTGISGGGRIALSGFVDFGTPSRFNLQADLNQVRVRFPTVFTSTLEGSLRLGGGAQRGEISGDLVVRQIFAPDNFNWLAYIGQAGSNIGLSRSSIESPIAPRIRLNVRVKSSPAVRFESRDLRLVGDIDVRLQGTLAEPVEVGHVQILSGEAVFRGNRYTIRRGDISMTNPFRTEAILNLEAQTRVQRYDLTVNISGPFSRLKIGYRSDPPLPTSDIVTLLAFGYARQQQEMATGTSHPAAAVGASAVLSQALSTRTSGRIQRLFGVSRIRIDPNAGGVGTTGGALITVEQQLAPELTLTYVTNTGVSQYRIIRMEWAVTDKVSIIGERDQGGIFGMEVQFRQRFR